MIAVDSSTLIAFIQGEPGSDVDAFDRGLASGDIVLPPPVITEILSDPSLPAGHRRLIISLPVMELLAGYWARAADTQRAVIAKKLRAPLADTLIAQCCIDHDVALITRDKDFRHFSRHCGLKLA